MPSVAGTPLSSVEATIAVYDYIADDYFMLDNSAYSIDISFGDGFDIAPASDTFTRVVLGAQKVNGISVSLPEDEPSSVEASGAFIRGRQYNLWMYRGSTPAKKWDRVSGAVFMGIKKSATAMTGVARRVELSFKGGRYVPQQDAAPDLDAYLTSINFP